MNRLFAYFLLCICLFLIGICKAQTFQPQVIPSGPTVPSPNNPFGTKIPSIPEPGGGYIQNRYRHPYSQPITTGEQVNKRLLAEVEEDMARRRAYSMPSCMGSPGTRGYQHAYHEIKTMLEGKDSLNLSRAVFLVENAYYRDSMDFSTFDSYLNSIVSTLLKKIADEGQGPTSNTAKILMLHRFFTDTIEIRNPRTGKKQAHYPFSYDFEDPTGNTDWSKQFVSKLLAEGSGQCHSLPLLYLMLAQKMETEAYLTFSPNHSYIRFKDGYHWHNLELTNGYLTNNTWVMGSGFIKAEAVQHELYMDTISLKRAVAVTLSDLANGYARTHCMDGFVKRVLNTSLQYHPMTPGALALLSNYYTIWFQHAFRVSGNPGPNDLYRYPEAVQIYRHRNALYGFLDKVGYQNMSGEAYQEWLQSAHDEAQQQEHTRLMQNINKDWPKTPQD
ncbi:MAG: hypothetical protein RLP14_02675 [Owenweeksia sp.]